MSSAVVIRAALPADEPSWRQLWRGYFGFLGKAMPEETAARTWARILDPDSAILCVVAEVDGKVYGFANCVAHENTWQTQPACYLEDLYVMPSARGHGIGTALVEWLRNAMRAEGWERLYWLAPAQDAASHRLYARFADGEELTRYVIRQK